MADGESNSQRCVEVSSLLDMIRSVHRLIGQCGESSDPEHTRFCLQMAHELAQPIRELANAQIEIQDDVVALKDALRNMDLQLDAHPRPV